MLHYVAILLPGTLLIFLMFYLEMTECWTWQGRHIFQIEYTYLYNNPTYISNKFVLNMVTWLTIFSFMFLYLIFTHCPIERHESELRLGMAMILLARCSLRANPTLPVTMNARPTNVPCKNWIFSVAWEMQKERSVHSINKCQIKLIPEHFLNSVLTTCSVPL